jgi:lipopolysaccharide export system protein LptA
MGGSRIARTAVASLSLLLASGAFAQAPPPAPEPEPAPTRAADPGLAAERLGLAVDAGAPMTIESDELEANQDERGRDRVIFQRNVRVEQGDMVLRCDWLEAIYPKRVEGVDSGGQPERITARGGVRIDQAGNIARCSEAVFNNQSCAAECISKQGRATLSRGEDVIEADRIFFDLCEGVLKARGKVRIRTQGAGASKKSGAGG